MQPRTLVKQYLERANLKAYHLAQNAGIPTSTLYKWLKGEANLTLDQWLKLERFINNKAA